MALTDEVVARLDAGLRRSRAPRPRRRITADQATMVALIAPSVLLLLLINAYPFCYALFQSLHNGTLISTGDFVGLANFISIFRSPTFWAAAGFTLVFTLVGVFGSWVVGLGLALLLRADMPGRTVLKVLLLLPWVVPIVVSAMSWNWLTATAESPLPTLARSLGLGTPLFLADPTLAAITVCVFKVWVSFPFMMLMSSAALSAVDSNVYEAASMDGANARQQFLQITLPLIARSTYIAWILMTIFCINDFPTIYLLTGGGPVNATASLVVLAYQSVFNNFQTGPGVAIAFLMTIIMVLISILLFRQIRKSSVE